MMPPSNEIYSKELLSPELNAQPHALIRLIGRITLAIGITMGPVIATDMAYTPTAEALTTFTNDYPDSDAVDCHIPYGQYSWCKGTPTTPHSSRGYDFMNCTDGAAYWTKKYTGIDVRGWGDAANWETGATTAGYTVYPGITNSIEPGDIAQSDDGAAGYGHVGFVTEVTKNSSGSVTSFKTAEMNANGLGGYSTPTYSSRNGVGKFDRGSGYDWDNFIDVNGFNKGLNNETLNAASSPSTSLDARIPLAGDFDGDGYQDLLAASKRSDGGPNFNVLKSVHNWMGGTSLWSAPSYLNWTNEKLAVGDMNGDGKSDVFAIQAHSDGSSDIYLAKSNGTSFNATALVGNPGLWFNDVKTWVSGDFNGDGKSDLLAVSKRSDAAPNLVVFPSNTTWLGGAALWGAPGTLKWADVVTVPADVDNDGKTDLLSIQPDSSGYANIYWSKSNGTSFDAPQLVGAPGLLFANLKNWMAGDYNGDGYDDLFVSSVRSDAAPNQLIFPSVTNWLGGSALWGSPSAINYANSVAIPADVDGNGKTDLLMVQTQSSSPYVYWSSSTGSAFNAPNLVGIPGFTPAEVKWQD